jgi:hypothetical protein
MKPPSDTNISLEPDGFTTASGTFVAWKEVREVVAYKEDWWTTDEICLGFRRNGETGYDRVNESAEEYDQVLAALPEVFPGIRTDWFFEVALPPFAENRTQLWKRSAG